MSPDLNSLPPSTDVPHAAGRAGSQGGDAPHESSPSQVGTSSSDPPVVPDVQPARRSPRPRAAMRINLHDPASPLGTGESEPPRRSPHLYRTSSGARREGLTGSGHPSPRSPISGAYSQGDPHHQRAPSLGELHQELEQEQEAQVMIRRQQAQLQQLQGASAGAGPAGEASGSSAVTDEAANVPLPLPLPLPAPRQISPGPRAASHASSPHSIRSRSRRSSQASPIHALTPPDATSAAAGLAAGRDEAAFYATETQSLTRENRMLRVRIRELERRVRDMEARERGEAPVDVNASEPSTDAAASTSHDRKDDDTRADPHHATTTTAADGESSA